MLVPLLSLQVHVLSSTYAISLAMLLAVSSHFQNIRSVSNSPCFVSLSCVTEISTVSTQVFFLFPSSSFLNYFLRDIHSILLSTYIPVALCKPFICEDIVIWADWYELTPEHSLFNNKTFPVSCFIFRRHLSPLPCTFGFLCHIF